MKQSHVKSNLLILGFVFIVLGVFALLFMGIGTFLELLFFKEGFSSLLLLFVFLLIGITQRLSWKNGGVFLVCALGIAGLAFDYIGNPLYNYPLNMMVGNGNSIDIIQHVSSYGGTTSINYSINIINSLGETVRSLNGFLFAFYRFTQYILTYSFLLSAIGLWTQNHPKVPKIKPQPFEPFEGTIETIEFHINRSPLNTRLSNLSEEELRILLTILMREEKIQAIKYLKDHQGLSLAEAKKWVDQWEEHYKD